MHVLVTGGAGFIGSAIVDLLAAEGHEVRVVDWLHPAAHPGPPDYLNPAATYTWADLRDLEVARSAVAGVDAVCHQAAMVGLGVDFGDVMDYVGHNDGATATLLRAMHERGFDGRTVLASSMVVYGEGRYRCHDHGTVRPGVRSAIRLDAGDFEPRCPACDGPLVAEAVTESAPTDPRNVYAATKLHQEHLVAAYAREHGGSWVALRYHNVYGPRMPRNTPYAGVASIFRSAAARGEPPLVFEDGGQRRDFVHVHDVARANVLALLADGGDDRRELSGAYNIATGRPRTVLDMAKALVAAASQTTDGSTAGRAAPRVVGGYRVGDVRHVFASPARAAERLGFTAEVGFDEGMADFAGAELRGANA